MKKVITHVASKVSLLSGVLGVFLFGMPSVVLAQDEEGFIPGFIRSIMTSIGITDAGSLSGSELKTYLDKRIRFALTLLFVIVFIVAIVYSALAAIKFMSSQGDSGKLEESKGAVKAILMGFAAMILAIIGLFVILWVLGSTEAPPQEIPEPGF
jgi:hypothetical protein